jgi:hypothetical protein
MGDVETQRQEHIIPLKSLTFNYELLKETCRLAKSHGMCVWGGKKQSYASYSVLPSKNPIFLPTHMHTQSWTHILYYTVSFLIMFMNEWIDKR